VARHSRLIGGLSPCEESAAPDYVFIGILIGHRHCLHHC
jgi:hypothetical protein